MIDHFLAVSDGEAMGQRLRFAIEEHHRKDFVVDQTLDRCRDFGQHAVEVQRGIDLLADLGERRQNALRQLLRDVRRNGIHSLVSDNHPV